MTDDAKKNPALDYLNTLQEVGRVFVERAPAEGDPELFGDTFSGLLESYLRPVLQTRRLAAVDAFVVMSLVEAAKLVSGGPQAQRFRDMMTAALAGSVHVERVTAQGNAARAAQAPEAPRTQEQAGEELKADMGAVLQPEPAQSFPEAIAAIEPVPLADALGHTRSPDERDEERADDEDLVRWVLDPGADAFADLLEEPVPNQVSRERRPGVTQEDVQARFDRVHGILDGTRPVGVSEQAWTSARTRVLPVTYGDKPAA